MAHNHDDYQSLKSVLNRAYMQAAEGKGRERHANASPFEAQPMQNLSDAMKDNGGLIFQATKKATEGYGLSKLPGNGRERAIAEYLGAINYLAGAVIWLERQDAKETAQERKLAE